MAIAGRADRRPSGRHLTPPLDDHRPEVWTRSCRLRITCGWPGSSHVEAELHYVPVRHQVILALDADLPPRLGLGHRAGINQVGERHHLGLDETALKVRVDHAR